MTWKGSRANTLDIGLLLIVASTLVASSSEILQFAEASSFDGSWLCTIILLHFYFQKEKEDENVRYFVFCVPSSEVRPLGHFPVRLPFVSNFFVHCFLRWLVAFACELRSLACLASLFKVMQCVLRSENFGAPWKRQERNRISIWTNEPITNQHTILICLS